jgi:hypothetical protein
LLLKNWYSNISPFNLIIKDWDFDNSVAYETLNWEDRFIYCIDELNNVFYQNSSWEFLKDNKGKRIIHIDTNSIKYFWDYRIYSFINEDWEWKIQIEPSLAFWVNFNNNIEWNSFNIKKISYLEQTLDENWNLIEVEEEKNYLLINDDEWRRLLNEDLEEISILDLLLFLNKNNPLTKKNLLETLDRFEEINVKEIFNIHNHNWVKFIEILVDLPVGYDDSWEEYFEESQVVLLNNWKVLRDITNFWETYIYSLGKTEEFLWKSFLSFSLTEAWWIDWYIDSFWKVVKIKEKRLLKIEETVFEFNWEKYFKINWKNDFFISKSKLLKELDLYDSFEESDSKFEILMEKWEYLEIDGNKYEKIVVNLSDELRFYLQKWNKREKIEFENLINKLKKTNNWQEALKIINITLNKLWY